MRIRGYVYKKQRGSLKQPEYPQDFGKKPLITVKIYYFESYISQFNRICWLGNDV